MYVIYYRIHLVNGQVLHVAECREPDQTNQDLIERYHNNLPDGLLEIGCDDGPTAFIPASNILYITRVSEEPAD